MSYNKLMADLVFTGESAGAPLNSDAMPANKDLLVYRGDYVELFVTVKDSLGAPVNLTGYTARASFKTNYEDLSPITINCTMVNPSSGLVKIYVSSPVSTTLVNDTYIWDFEIINAQGDSRTYLTGDVTVYPEVTNL